MQKAEMDMANTVLGTLSVQEVTQYLELLFAQLYMAGGEPVSEVRKISLALRVFTNTAFDSTRATIQTAWQNGHQYTFDEVMSRFAGEEGLRFVASGTTTGASSEGAVALRSVQQAPPRRPLALLAPAEIGPVLSVRRMAQLPTYDASGATRPVTA
ncbi:unnamed protein product [Tilletia controversa]|nr:unnamed protein product [Tilletia controversa]